MLTTDILRKPPFNLSAAECSEFMALAAKFDITLDGFLHGIVYSPNAYTEEEQERIYLELINIFSMTFTGKTPGPDKRYTATAGAPGVGKSTFIEQLIAKDPTLQSAIYVDPDRQALRYMQWYKDLSDKQSGEIAYTTCRDASNYICNLLLVWAIYKGYSVVHGTTSTNLKVASSILPQLREAGYSIDIHVLFAAAQARESALKHRIIAQDFYQVTQTDALGKVAPVFERLMDAYIKYGDNVTIYYNTGEYWLAKNPEESKHNLQRVAYFCYEQDPKVQLVAEQADLLDTLIRDVRQEVPIEKQEQIIAMLHGWRNNHGHVFLPAFNRHNVLAGLGLLAVAGAAMCWNTTSGDSTDATPKPNL